MKDVVAVQAQTSTGLATPMLGMAIPFTSMQEIIDFSKMMATAKGAVPAIYLQNPGACMAVTMQAIRWGMDPFAVAQKTHEIRGVIGYEGQLINAIVTSMAPTTGRLQYEWYGDWSRVIGNFIEKTGDKGKYTVPGWTMKDEEGCGIRVWATMKGETEPRVLDLLLTQAGVRNSTLWATDPKQQLAYLAVKRWARLYCPDVILGVYSRDELEERPVGEREIGPGAVAGTSDLDIKPKSKSKPTNEAAIVDPAAGATEAVQQESTDVQAEDGVPFHLSDPADEVVVEEGPLTFACVAEAVNKASNPDEMTAAVTKMADFIALDGNDKYKKELSDLYKHRVATLRKQAADAAGGADE